MPSKLATVAGALRIDSGFRVAATKYSDARLQSAMSRFTARVSRQTGIPLLPSTSGAALSIECSESGTEYPALGEEESYRLDVSPDGARLVAQSVTGALRGWKHFAQLIERGADSFEVRESISRTSAISVARVDARCFAPLDACRGCRANLDAMAAVKLNVFTGIFRMTRVSCRE